MRLNRIDGVIADVQFVATERDFFRVLLFAWGLFVFIMMFMPCKWVFREMEGEFLGLYPTNSIIMILLVRCYMIVAWCF